MKGSGVIAAAAVAIVAAAIFAWQWAAVPIAPAGRTAARPSTIVLITIDTLRADRLGAYGWASARTPAIDGLAARGVRFDRAYATAPITLPSHASLLTGLYPPGHASRHNGMHVRPDVATLAGILHEQGWATGACVGAFPLDRRYGLARGFDHYGDRMPRRDDGRQMNERPGRAVVDECLEWLRDAGARPALLWVHLFEPHAPYLADPSRGPAGRTLPPAARYDDEIAEADRQVARLLDGIAWRTGETLTILAGDHGEAFGEHGEVTHSIFLYDTTLRVPLVVAGPGIAPSVSGTAVSLADVAPTVIDLLGLPSRGLDGASLAPLLRGGAIGPRDLYAETFAPLLDFGWSPLRSVRSGGVKYIDAPRPELFDTAIDPAEEHDLTAGRADAARHLAARVNAFSGPELAATPAAAEDAEARSRLSALGYVQGSRRDDSTTARPDPKDRKDLAAKLSLVFSDELTGVDLRAALEDLAAAEPANAQVRSRLGFVLVDAGELRQAEPHFRSAIAAGMVSADPYLGLALCLTAAGKPREAQRALEDSELVEPGNPVVEANLGLLAMDTGRLDAALSHLATAIGIDPDLHQARFNLVRALARAGRRAAALAQATELLARLPADAPQRAEVERLIRALQ